jgi:O-antigen ligase
VWCFFVYLTVVAIATLNVPPNLQVGGVLTTMIQLVLFSWVASNVFRDSQLANQVMNGYALATVVLSVGIVAALPGFAESIPTGKDRLTAFDYNPNGLATLAAVGAVVLLGAFVNAKRLRERVLLGAAAAPVVVLIIRTGSRSGALSLVAGLALFLTPVGGARRRIAAMGLAAVVLLGAVYFIATDPLMGSRLDATIEEGDTAGRDHIYRAAVDLVLERPLVGWGPGYGMYELGRRLNIAWARDTHNFILYLLLEGGLIETIPFLLGLYLVVRAAWRGRHGPLGIVPLAMVAVVLTSNLSHTYLSRKPMWLALAIGLAAAPQSSHLRRLIVRRPRKIATTSPGMPRV